MQTLSQQYDKLFAEGKYLDAFYYALDSGIHFFNCAANAALRGGDLDAALKVLEFCTQISPESGLLFSNIAYVLGRMRRHNEALVYSQKAIDTKEPLAAIYYNHGVILNDLGRLEEAAEAYRNALSIQPDYPIVHFNLGSVLMNLGQFAEGLKEYEWRFKSHDILESFRKRFDKPDWDGKEDISDKILLVYNEQGCGDAVQFARYLPMLATKAKHVIVEVQKELSRLFTNSELAYTIHGRSSSKPAYDATWPPQLPDYDLVVSFSSLPYLMGATVDNINQFKMPYMKAGGVSRKLKSFMSKHKKFNVGLCWAGSSWHPNDQNRSCLLKHFKPLLDLPNIEFFSLFKGPTKRQWTEDLNADVDMSKIIEIPGLVDFNETAGAMHYLDLIITVDTTIAHLAGALNIPVWLLVPASHDWRWFTDRTDSPWYPSMKIYRQEEMGDWHSLMYRVFKDLESYGRREKSKSRTKGKL